MQAAAPADLAGRRAVIGLTAGLAVAALMALAGGIGTPVAVLLAALICLPRPALWARLAAPEPALIAALAFLLWATLSLLWSPAGPRQIALVWVEVAAGAGVLLAASHAPERMRRLPRLVFVCAATALALALALEATTGGAVTAAVKGMDPYDRRVLSMLGRGAAAAIILIPPACAMALQMGRAWILAAFAMLGGAIIASIGFDIQANQMAVVLAAFAFVFAWRAPRAAIMTFAIGFTLWLVLFPAGVLVMDPVMQPRRAQMPFSWEWRWEAWSYALELIGQRPLFGWGVDSARHFGDATVQMRGYELSRIPMHTHSASMQIWLETGLVGLALLCATLLLTARRIARAPIFRPQAAASVGAAVAVALVLSTSYGFWQEWLWCAAILTAAACFLVGPGPQPAPRAEAAS